MAPLSRTSAGTAPGSSVHRVTLRFGSAFSVSGAVAAGTNSRIAIRSVSPGSPANGRARKSGGGPDLLPWQDLYCRPDPHGHGWRGPTSPAAASLERPL